MSSYDFDLATIDQAELNEDVLYAIVDFAICNPLNAALMPVEYNAIEDRRDALVEFWLNNHIQPVPAFEELVIVWRKADSQIPAYYISAAVALGKQGFGTKFVAGSETYKNGKTVLVGCPNKELFGMSSDPMSVSSIHCVEYNPATHAGSSTVYADQFSNMLMNWVSTQLSHLTNEQLVELSMILSPKIKVYEDNLGASIFTGSNGNGLFVNYANKEVVVGTSDNRSLTAMNTVSIGANQVDSAFVLFVTSVFAAFGKASVRNFVNELPNLWEREPNYGVAMDNCDPTKVMMDETPLPVEFVYRNADNNTLNVWPWVIPSNGKFNLELMDSMMDSNKAVVMDKYAMQFAGNDLAANAGLLGRRQVEVLGEMIDEMLTLHDAGKPSKFFNRLTQARKHLKAHVEGREVGNFYSLLSNGTSVAQSGKRLKTLVTNSRLASGSGPAFFNPATKMKVEVSKTLTFKVTYDALSLKMRSALETNAGKLGDRALGMAHLKSLVVDKLEAAIEAETVFNTGESIIRLEGKNFFVNDKANQPIRLTEVKKLPDFIHNDKGYTPDSFQITVGVVLSVEDSWFKLRNDGIKLTTLPYTLEWFDRKGLPVNQEWDIVLNNETRKGRVLEVSMFCLANGGGVYDANTGILIMNNGQVIDLTKGNNAVASWVRSNTKTLFMQLAIAKAEWNVMKSVYLQSDVEVINETATYVVVRERIQVLEGDYLFEVEISTPRENTGTSSMTPEQLAALSLQNRALAESINAESAFSRQAVTSLVKMVVMDKIEDATRINLSTKEGRDLVLQSVGSIDGKSHRDVVKAFEKAFPAGVVFTAQSTNGTGAKSTLFLDFKVINSMMTFMSGSASGVSLDVVAFLTYILNLDVKGYDSKINSKVKLLKKSLQGWMRTSMESNGVLKKAARTAKVCVNGKVRTSYSPYLHHAVDDLPKIMINSNCASAVLLAKSPKGGIDPVYLDENGEFNPFLLNGTIVGIGRTPMPFVTACQLVVTPETDKEIGIAHFMLLPHVWAASNEGDSDGDGLFAINLDSRGVTFAEALAMNNHPMGMAGYQVVYGSDSTNWPCAEFSSFGDKWGKKRVATRKGKTAAYVTCIPVEKYKEAAVNVSQHYKSAVGIAYGICSALTFKTVELSYNSETSAAVLDTYTKALVVCWRMLYEGLGLAGYTPTAKRFFQVLNIASTSKGADPQFIEVDGNPTWIKKDTPKTVARISCIDEMVNLLSNTAGDSGFRELPNKSQIVKLIVCMERIRSGRTAIEQGKENRVKSMKLVDKTNIALYTGLRALGQGKNTSGIEELEAKFDDAATGEDVIPQSVFSVCSQTKVWETMKCNWLAELLETGCWIHGTVSKKLYQIKKAEDEGQD